MSIAIPQTPALLVGSGLSTLGAIRLLGRAGVRTYCFGKPDIEATSRWYRPAPGMDPLLAQPGNLAKYLRSGALDRAVLIPASDAAVRAVASLPDDLRERFPSSVSDRAIADQLTDKALFADLLTRTGVPGPVTTPVSNLDDIDRIPDAFFTGAFLKPVDSARFMERFGVKGVRVSTRQEAQDKAKLPLSEGHRFVLQEYVPTTVHPDGTGARGDHILIDGFIDASGHVTGMFARRRLRMFPVDFGNTTHMVSIPLSEVATAAADLERLITSVRHRGIFSGEFKQDPRDGTYKLLEVNARVWWFVEYAGRCGFDVCTMSYLDALGEKIDDVCSYRLGQPFVQFYFDFHAIRALRRDRRIGLVSAMRSWVGAQEPTFNWSDPLPAAYDLLARAQLSRRIAHKTQVKQWART